MTARGRRISAVMAAVMAGLAACSYRGGDIGDAMTRKFRWYSYLQGDDIRTWCPLGSGDRFRVVYNAIYGEQVRMYDLDAARRFLVVHVTQPNDAAVFTLDDPLAPGRAQESRAQLRPAEYDRMIEAFAASGMFAPPPVGLRLPSRSYFWTAAWCRNGTFGFTAWRYPSPSFDAIGFDRLLFALDFTEVPVAQPAPVPFDPLRADEQRKGLTGEFTLEIGPQGLVR